MFKHLGVAKEAWKHERAQKGKRTKTLEADFLPAALEVMERPANPVGRMLVWVLVLLFSIALLLSWFGKIDTVAVAQGKVMIRSSSKSVQAPELGRVRRILVENGSVVEQGQILIELDATFSSADSSQAAVNLQTAEIAHARAQALYDFSLKNTADTVWPVGISIAARRTQDALIESRIGEYKAAQQVAAHQSIEAIAERTTVVQELAKLKETLPLLEEQISARLELMKKGLSPRLLYLELEERRITQVRNIAIQEAQLVRVNARIDILEGSKRQFVEEFRSQVISEIVEAADQAALYSAELDKAQMRNSLQQLRAPVDGVVQQLTVHTLGGVVQAAEPLMVIVPRGGELVAEAIVLNKDIGSIIVGDPVEVKLDAFPFTKHGVIHGQLENLSLDAIQDENLGLVYSARIALNQSYILSNNKKIYLTPGMSLTAEIKTGKKRILEFVISPLLRYRAEALRER